MKLNKSNTHILHPNIKHDRYGSVAIFFMNLFIALGDKLR